ncbi:MAG: N-acetylmuramoyl-L-alanine amidase, partial [Candidatus Latescibacterota bacterium]
MKYTCNILLAVILGIAVGCAAPPRTIIDRIYTGLSEELPRLDPSILQGRKIVIDPGHGGFFRGTVGPDSLEEARVNLGVSLYLWGLLKEAGAEILMTRSAERDFLIHSDSSLAFDPQKRVAMACSLQPDILVSIHHNAQSNRDPAFNQVETYYRTGDPASMDLAVAVHRHLMRNLGIQSGEVRQGNYYILRNVEMPAIIGESSYLTHPMVEENLKLSDKQRLEAEAYFLGILEYFHRGIPRLRRTSPAETTLTSVPTIEYHAEDTGGLGIDPDGIRMVVNRTEVKPVFDRSRGNIIYPLAWDAPNGLYALTLTARNLLGNSSHEARCEFKIDFPPESAHFAPTPNTVPPAGGTIRVQ